MEPFDLPTLDGLHLVEGLCDGVLIGAEALAGFPSLHTLPHTASLGHHGVNVHGSESRNKSMIVHIENELRVIIPIMVITDKLEQMQGWLLTYVEASWSRL